MKKVKVISDGRPAGTKCVDAETGEDLRLPVTSIHWAINATNLSVARVELEMTQAEFVGHVNPETVESWINSVLEILPPDVLGRVCRKALFLVAKTPDGATQGATDPNPEQR